MKRSMLFGVVLLVGGLLGVAMDRLILTHPQVCHHEQELAAADEFANLALDLADASMNEAADWQAKAETLAVVMEAGDTVRSMDRDHVKIQSVIATNDQIIGELKRRYAPELQ